MPVLVDTSVWIDYFKNGKKSSSLDSLIDNNQIVTNDLILTELLPFIELKGEKKLSTLLRSIKKVEIFLDWEQLIQFQVLCLKNGINKTGIPDLIIIQNALQNHLTICSFDKHFSLINHLLPFELHDF